MNRPAVCVIQYTPWTGISSYKRGTHFNVFTASNSIHVELHHVYHNSAHYHNNTLQYCTEGCLHNITAKQGVSAVKQRWFCLAIQICIFDYIRLYFSHSYYGPALTLHICICIFDFSLTLPTLQWSSWFQLYFTTRCDWWRTQRLLRGNDRSPFPSVAMLPFVLYCLASCQLYLLLVVCPIAICPSYITWLVFVNDWSSLPCVMCIPIAICHHFCSGHSSLLVRNAPMQITPSISLQ